MNVTNSPATGVLSFINNISPSEVDRKDSNMDSSIDFDEYGNKNKELFNSLDSNGDGKLTKTEISNAIIQKLEEYEDQEQNDEQKVEESKNEKKFASILADTMNENSTSTSNTTSETTLNNSTTTVLNNSSIESLKSNPSLNSAALDATKMLLNTLSSQASQAFVPMTAAV